MQRVLKIAFSTFPNRLLRGTLYADMTICLGREEGGREEGGGGGTIIPHAKLQSNMYNHF